jgi:hypothetical protein
MAIENFIPEIWAAKVFQDFDKASVLGAICNRDYEGEISQGGDTVRITAVGPVTVNSYTKNSTSNMTVQTLNDAQTVLTIDQQKYFNFQIDDVDAAQQKPKIMGEAMRKAAVGLAQNVDTFVANLYTFAAAGSSATVTNQSSDFGVLNVFGRAAQLLSENDCPVDGRFAVISPFVQAMMAKQNIALTLGQDKNLYTNGYIGRYMGFDVIVSNNLATGSTHTAASPVHEIMFGTKDAITLAFQINKVEAYRPQGTFSDAVKGLLLYGGKVIQPKALCTMEVRYASS